MNTYFIWNDSERFSKISVLSYFLNMLVSILLVHFFFCQFIVQSFNGYDRNINVLLAYFCVSSSFYMHLPCLQLHQNRPPKSNLDNKKQLYTCTSALKRQKRPTPDWLDKYYAK